VMRELLLRKFEQEVFRRRLLAWQGPIVEWNTWHDTRYGKCTCPRHNGEGENILGQLLTEIREELRREAADGTDLPSDEHGQR